MQVPKKFACCLVSSAMSGRRRGGGRDEEGKLIHDPKFESSRDGAKRGLDILEEPDEDEFAADDPRNVTLIT